MRVPLAEEEISTSKQATEAGQVRIHKEVETEVRQVTVPVTREDVRVERVAVEGVPGTEPVGEPSFQESTVTIPVYEEQIEVTKRPVVREEVIVTKEAVQEQRTVEAAVRKEKADVQKQDKPKRGPKAA